MLAKNAKIKKRHTVVLNVHYEHCPWGYGPPATHDSPRLAALKAASYKGVQGCYINQTGIPFDLFFPSYVQ